MPTKPMPDYQEERINEIRSFVRNSRINSGLTQFELSRKADLHVNSLQRFEKGFSRNISLITLFSLIDALEMPLSEFFAGME
jgi:transcriptional regulator with XRE-family HTH domain